MNILPKSAPSSVRPGSSYPKTRIGAREPEPRPYLISLQARRAGAPQRPALPLFPHESEDARLTGSTRSLYRRLLGLNLPCTPQYMPMADIQGTVMKVNKFKAAKESKLPASKMA